MYSLSTKALHVNFNVEERTKQLLDILDQRKYQEVIFLTEITINNLIKQNESNLSDEEKNDIFILNSFFNLFRTISLLWNNIENTKYYNSWVCLQDSLDILRCIKKFHKQNSKTLAFFEKQLLSLEKLYPYNIFSSMGFIESNHECSICHNDMDSDDCPHLKGELYAGELALAIIKKIERLDHIALVFNPRDKRLVVGVNDQHPSFKVFVDLMGYFKKSGMSPLGFTDAVTLDFKKINPEWRLQSRNDACACGSGKKFKKCCINKKDLEHRHIEFTNISIFQKV